MFHCHRAVSFCNLIFPWLNFICKILQIMDAQAALFWNCFNEPTESLQGCTTEELKMIQAILHDVEPKEISPWQASRVYAALTLQKPLVQPKDVLAMLLGEEVDLPKAEKVREEVG